MSSSHLIIVARNTDTSEIELPLGGVTMYGSGGEEELLNTVRQRYSEDWVLAVYRPDSDFYVGEKHTQIEGEENEKTSRSMY